MTTTRHPVGNVEWADGYSYLKFRGEVQIEIWVPPAYHKY